MPGSQRMDRRTGIGDRTGDEVPIPELIRRARHARGLTADQLAQRLSEVARDPYPTGALVLRWERGARIPGPYWRSLLGQALDLPGDRLERAAATARLRRALAAAAAGR